MTHAQKTQEITQRIAQKGQQLRAHFFDSVGQVPQDPVFSHGQFGPHLQSGPHGQVGFDFIKDN
ncbi:MAG: hypothetical protein U0518_03590 [Candidatus Gracilibacteria bacterium]